MGLVQLTSIISGIEPGNLALQAIQ